ncbi:MAG: hypothetical protein EA376_10240 [Phycisphaeraceae bacterium]|nr:MAG: hypothetical protein EA376_10240 [Phycisphaeraceae bacterium]
MQNYARAQFGEFLDAIASKTPMPGGGAVSSAAGALGAAQARMVISYSIGKKSLAAHQDALQEAADRIDAARRLLLDLADEDALAYGAMSELMKLPKDDLRRVRELPGAVVAAIGAPRAVIACCADLLRIYEQIAPITNTHLHSDLIVAAVLTEAAGRASRGNIVVNLPALSEIEFGDDGPHREKPVDIIAQVDHHLSESLQRLGRIEDLCA